MDITKSGSILCLYKRFEKMAFMPMIPTPLCFVMVIVSTLIIPCGIYVCHFKNIQNKRFITHLVLTHLRKVSSRLNAIKVEASPEHSGWRLPVFRLTVNDIVPREASFFFKIKTKKHRLYNIWCW